MIFSSRTLSLRYISDFGKIRFPSLYASKIVSEFSSEKKHLLEYLGWEASKRLGQKNFEFVTPIKKGRPIERYQHHIGLLVETLFPNSALIIYLKTNHQFNPDSSPVP